MFDGFKTERKSISEEVVYYIRDLIHQGRFSSGEKIPGERELAQKINVSRNTIREAYKILAAQGYLTIKHGQGVFVSDEETYRKNFASSFFVKHDDVVELFAIRKVLETQAVAWAVDSDCTPGQIAGLESILADARQAAQSHDYDEVSRLDLKFHLSLVRMSDNSILHRIMMNLIDLLSEVRTQSVEIPGRCEQSLLEHSRIIEAIKQNNKELAVQNMLNHLESVQKSILIHQKGSEAVSIHKGNEMMS
ncbi:FadR/GntR family transcriptional regulator [Ammoniphilus sp. CFH 90114]|uniref:FadR/GntR family transcriptional regulator n=1 Tax=Ammoniphilus sp. CFH 90114 TaxID=2493665 RepID=UPI00100E3EBB|nr:FadR/GntR family transcriptional regulator [Ammoniphilus sp. CFH 90114]RXT07225.1 FadR family transcriptional regulator [Ammoniphilus sp. CFH 90114]